MSGGVCKGCRGVWWLWLSVPNVCVLWSVCRGGACGCLVGTVYRLNLGFGLNFEGCYHKSHLTSTQSGEGGVLGKMYGW